MRVDEIMTRFPATVRLGADLHRAAEMIAVSEIGQLMVLDDGNRFVGILSEGDLVRALLPDPAAIRAGGGSVAAAFAAFLDRGRTQAARPVDELVRRDPVTLGPADHVAAAAALMADRGIRRLPVVDSGRLCGTVSRTDVCRAVLAHTAGSVDTVAATVDAPRAASVAPPAATASPTPTVPSGSGAPLDARTLAARLAEARTPAERVAVVRAAQAERTAAVERTPARGNDDG